MTEPADRISKSIMPVSGRFTFSEERMNDFQWIEKNLYRYCGVKSVIADIDIHGDQR